MASIGSSVIAQDTSEKRYLIGQVDKFVGDIIMKICKIRNFKMAMVLVVMQCSKKCLHRRPCLYTFVYAYFDLGSPLFHFLLVSKWHCSYFNCVLLIYL